ncbi:alpha-L-fucosidase, partial [Xylanibacter caecicola]
MTAQQRFEPNWKSLDKRKTPSWFEDAKFGIFV